MVKITTLTPSHWNILRLLYESRNEKLHLRDIARKLKLDPKATKRHLDWLCNNSWLKASAIGNMVQYELRSKEIIRDIYPLLDSERFKSLKISKQQAIQYYIRKLPEKPIMAILFGSTVNKTDTKSSDIDIMLVVESKISDKTAKQYVMTQTGEVIQSFQVTFFEFIKELKMQEDKVLMSAIGTGYPIFNEKYYYEVLNEQKRN